MRILITGSRDWEDLDTIHDALTRAVSGHHGDIVVVHGAAKGADNMSALAAWAMGLKVEAHPAMWQKHTDECPDWHEGLPTCKMAGFRRNREMVELGADLCLAFIKDESKGASMTAKLAEDAGIQTWRFTA